MLGGTVMCAQQPDIYGLPKHVLSFSGSELVDVWFDSGTRLDEIG
jgi:hypothetical protein